MNICVCEKGNKNPETDNKMGNQCKHFIHTARWQQSEDKMAQFTVLDVQF